MTRAQLKKIAKSKNATHYYIYKNGSYYRPKASGYTDYITSAGIYEKSEALEHAYCCDDLTLIPIDSSKHNKLILNEVKELLSRII